MFCTVIARSLALAALVACAPAELVVTPDTADTDAPVDTDTPIDTADTDSPISPPASGCTVTAQRVTCPYDTWRGADNRAVHYRAPLGTPPPAGWPVALLFQGSFFSGETFFDGRASDPFGGLHQAQLTAALLTAGSAVIAPEASGNGGLFWDTNIPPWSLDWSGGPDDRLIQSIFAAIDDGTFGSLDPDRLVAAGISSGGYMSSRMAIAYPDRFAAVAIQSASYANCSGPICIVPAQSADHPPTLFLHGGIDVVVPQFTTTPYRSALTDAGVPEALISDAFTGHAWLPAAPAAVVAWFAQHR